MAKEKKKAIVIPVNITQILAIIFVLALFAGAAFLAQNYSGKTTNLASLNLNSVKSVIYNGQEGKNVLELLKEKENIKTIDTPFGLYVEEINGNANSDKNYWNYYVNGEPATTNPDKYITKDNDQIEWRFDGI